jgi:hypothetical protein
VRTSEDKVRRKDLCWSVRAVYVLEKRPDISGLGLKEVGRYTSARVGDCSWPAPVIVRGFVPSPTESRKITLVDCSCH